MRALVAGEIPKPSIAHTLGFDLVEVDRGRAVFSIRGAARVMAQDPRLNHRMHTRTGLRSRSEP
jgi:hypothetical protein